MCIIMTYLHCCMAETNTTLLSNFPPLKKKISEDIRSVEW